LLETNLEKLGIKKFAQFKAHIMNGTFKFLYIFSDGSFIKKKGKLFYRKTKKYGSPCIIFPVSNLEFIPELDRRESIAEDINQDLIWIQKLNIKKM